MIEHGTVFKNQVSEPRHSYRIQRDTMEESKRKEMNYRPSGEPASLSTHQVQPEDAQKWHMAGFPLLNSSDRTTSVGGHENFSSPLSCTNGQFGQSPLHYGSASKDSEALDSRPLKVRKKLFDLQLPADLYEDHVEEEILHDCNMICKKGTTSQSPFQNRSTLKDSETLDSRSSKAGNKLFDLQLPANLYEDLEEEENLRNHKESDISSCTRKSGANLFFGSYVGKKTDLEMGDSDSVWRSKGVVDLNKPIPSEKATAPLCFDFLGRPSGVETTAVHHLDKPASHYLGLTGDRMLVQDGFLINSSTEVQVNDRGWLSRINGAGSSRGNLGSVVQGNRSDKLPLPSHPGERAYHGLEDQWREGIQHGLESSRSYHQSQTPSPYSFFNSSSRAHPTLSWAKQTNSFAQNITAREMSDNAAGTMSRTLHPSNEYFGRKCGESGSRSIPGFASETKSNTGFNYLNCSNNVASHRSTNLGFTKLPVAESKPVIDINLNETFIMQDGKSRPEDDLRALPWLKPKVACGTSRSELTREFSSFCSTSSQLCCQSVTVGDSDISREKGTAQTKTVQKILGVAIFERDIPENGPSSHRVSVDHSERKKGIIDMNVAFEPDEQIGFAEMNVVKEKKNISCMSHIDLNRCVSDFEDPPLPRVKRTFVIDLEAPVFLESEDELLETKQEQTQDEVVRNLAETIVAISANPPQEDLPSVASIEEALVWFVNIVSVCKSNTSSGTTDHEMDDFEAMTLQLPEMREEEYIPAPFVHEIQETGGVNAFATRSKRGQSKRRRVRKEFQKDILPGLTSLSRHEITEDLQTFGGMMRDTGHSWNLGLNRRSGTRNMGGRGRRQVVVETASVPVPVSTPLIKQLNSTEGSSEARSLTGWGKTTRRPRRQRSHAGGNPNPNQPLGPGTSR